MKITKLGHCCLLIEVKGLRILTDPGAYTTSQNSLTNIDLILISHEHSDHCHVDFLKEILKNNPQAKVVTNRGVGKILEKENIKYTLLEDGKNLTVQNLLIEGVGKLHEQIYPGEIQVENVGYFIDNAFFYPGDAFTNPNKPVEILALPISGNWMKLSEAIDYAKLLKPTFCFPVHDGILKYLGSAHKLPEKLLNKEDIKFEVLEIEKPKEF